MMIWEYRVEELSEVQMASQLNFIGVEGWELVWVQNKKDGESSYTCIFKRQKERELF